MMELLSPERTSYLSLLLNGTYVTIKLTVLGCLLAVVVAFLLGFGKLSTHALLRWPCNALIEFFRGTSVLVQLFWIFYTLPLLGIRPDPMTSGVLALGLNVGSYGAEVVRGAVLAIPPSQIEASIALNLSKWQLMSRIVVPQALVGMLPSFGNLAIDLLKASSLCSLITISDLTFQAQVIRAATGSTAPPFLTAVVMYLILASMIVWIVRRLEVRFSKGIEMERRL